MKRLFIRSSYTIIWSIVHREIVSIWVCLKSASELHSGNTFES